MLRLTAAALAALCGIACPPSFARNYPNRPIRVTIPFGPSSAGDTIARAVTPHMGQTIKQTMVMDNRPGAGGNIAAEITSQAVPDGHTIMMATIGTHAINAALYSKLPYDPVKNFTPIGMTATSPNTLVLHSSVPAKSVEGLIALVKAKPGAYNFGSTGIGTSVVSRVAVQFARRTEGGAHPAQGRAGSLGRRAHRAHPLHVRQHVVLDRPGEVGELRALAVTSAKRHPACPTCPRCRKGRRPRFRGGGLVRPGGARRHPAAYREDAERCAAPCLAGQRRQEPGSRTSAAILCRVRRRNSGPTSSRNSPSGPRW